MNGHYIDEGLGFSIGIPGTDIDISIPTSLDEATDMAKRQGSRLFDKAKDEGQKFVDQKKDEFVDQSLNRLGAERDKFVSNLTGGNQSKPSSAPLAPSSVASTTKSSNKGFFMSPALQAIAKAKSPLYDAKKMNAVMALQNTAMGRKIKAFSKSVTDPTTQNVVRNIGAQQTMRAFEKSNTMLYVGLGVAAVAVIGGALYFTRK